DHRAAASSNAARIAQLPLAMPPETCGGHHSNCGTNALTAYLKFERLLETHLAFAPRGSKSFSMAIPIWFWEKLFQKNWLIAEDPGRTQPRAAYPRRCSSNASGLPGRNSAGFPQICATFQRDNLRRHF